MLPAPLVKVGYRAIPGTQPSQASSSPRITLTDEDVRLLRLIAGRYITVRLVCRGQPDLHMAIPRLLERLRRAQDQANWYLRLK
jgi:hypothetical protein